jgi:hypothetical protein
MGEPIYNVDGQLSPNDENALILRIETSNLNIIKDSIKRYRTIKNNVELLETKYFLEAVDEYPDTFLIIDIDPIVFDDKKGLYICTLYCYGNDELDSKMDMLKRFFEKCWKVKSMKKLKELIEYNLTEVLLILAITFICIAIEIGCFVLLIKLAALLGFLGFLGGACLMLFVTCIYLFLVVSIYKWC